MNDELLDTEIREALDPPKDAVGRVVEYALDHQPRGGFGRLALAAAALAVVAAIGTVISLRDVAAPEPSPAVSGRTPGPGPSAGAPPRGDGVAANRQGEAAPPAVIPAPSAAAPASVVTNVSDTVVVQSPSGGTWLIGGSRRAARRAKSGGSIVMMEPGGDK